MKTNWLLALPALFYSLILYGENYRLENLPFPNDLPPEIGDLAFDKDGNLYACLRRGDVLVSKPQKDLSKLEWKVFAKR